MTKFRKFSLSLAAMAVATAPVVAQAADSVDTRAPAEIGESEQLDGEGSILIILLAAAAVIAGIILLGGDDDEDAPFSP